MNFTPYFSVVENQDQVRDRQFTLKSLINEQVGFVAFLVLSVYSFIGDFRGVAFATYNPAKKITAKLLSNAKLFLDKKSKVLNHGLQTPN